jgi:beta-glucosidase
VAFADSPLAFPDHFLWGTATSAHQVEGDNSNNDWWHWEQQLGRIARGERSGAAVEWWRGRAEEDLRRAAALGHSAHRLSVEWSRLEPRPGQYDAAAFERYRQILGTIRTLGMTTCLTLHHFTLPRWVAEGGGWLHADMPDRVAKMAAACAERLGDLVDLWVTINEPSVLAYKSCIEGSWPPGKTSIPSAVRALAQMLRAHDAALRALRQHRPDARIGIVLNLPAFDPARARKRDRVVARLQDDMFNGLFLRALENGVLPFPLSTHRERLPAGPNAADWYGLNYYGRHVIRFAASQPGRLFGREVQEGVHGERVNWGDPFPEGLTRGLLRLARMAKPLYVTENGIADRADTQRPRYLLRHIRATHDAIAAGADVRGYFHWSLLDNFEWTEGWGTPFGLIAVDLETQERRPRRSATVYEKVIRANGIVPELWQEEVENA